MITHTANVAKVAKYYPADTLFTLNILTDLPEQTV